MKRSKGDTFSHTTSRFEWIQAKSLGFRLLWLIGVVVGGVYHMDFEAIVRLLCRSTVSVAGQRHSIELCEGLVQVLRLRHLQAVSPLRQSL